MSLSTGRKVLGGCLIVGPLLFALSTLIGPDTSNGDSVKDQLKDLGKIADHKSAFLASGIIFLVAAVLFIIATYGIVHVYRGRKLGVGQVGGGLIAMGMAVFFTFYGFGLIQYEMVNHAEFKNAADQLLFARLLHFGTSSGAGSIIFIAFILGIVLGPILLGIGMLRRRNVPMWAGILTILTGPVGFFIEGKAANTVFQLVLLAALAPLALLMWNMTDEEWDAPRDVAGARQDRPVVAEPTAAPAAPAV